MTWHKAFPFIRDERGNNLFRIETETSFIPQRPYTREELKDRMAKVVAILPVLDVLKSARQYIDRDLEHLRRSFLPAPTPDETDALAEAEALLRLIDAALTLANEPIPQPEVYV